MKQILPAVVASVALIVGVQLARGADNPPRPADGNIDLPTAVADGDVVELNSGQRLVGDWTDASLTIWGRLGELTVPARQVTGLKSEGPGAVSEFLVTRGGDVLVGRLVETSLHFHLHDGSSVALPVGDISRMARRIAAPTTQPMGRGDGLAPLFPSITTDRGDQFAIESPASIGFWTRYGHLKLEPKQIATIELRVGGQPGDRLTLTDGSVLYGLMDGPAMKFQPRALNVDSVTVPVAALVRMDFSSFPAAPGDCLHLSTGDVLSGKILGSLTLESGQGDVIIRADQIRTINPVEDSPGDFRVTEATGSSITGPPAAGDIEFQLRCGQTIKVPMGLISNYTSQ
ncbi:MAG TPA: hypothetical protein VMD30_02170 [Tepidisphaeraceae bacterium]|nr:hypothetical protein [Tepidisphaeraceae bacterium]